MPPIGWYLAQGLYPLGHDSSDDDEGPAELPNGRLVCGRHGLVVCAKCTVDYSFMEEDDDGDDNARDLDKNGTRRDTGQVFATKFVPPSADAVPTEVFSGRKRHRTTTRYTLPNDPGTCVIHTDGACLDNGQLNPRAGWSFWHGENNAGKAIVSGRLEMKGPSGDEGAQTSNRAELRAVIAALRFRDWPGEGLHTCVFATDSEYVVEGCTSWARRWIRDGWRTRARKPVANKDLWMALLDEIRKKHDDGMAVQFWGIPRDLNTTADAAARAAAGLEEAPGEWLDITGSNI